MRAAVIDPNGTVTNVIVADAGVDPAPSGYSLINISENIPVSTGYLWSVENGFTNPNPVETPAYSPVLK